MEFEMTKDAGRLAIAVSGRLDARSSPALADEMKKALDDVVEIVFDLDGLEYISSAGMRILLASFKLMEKRGGAMRVENAQAGGMDALHMSGFASLFCTQ